MGPGQGWMIDAVEILVVAFILDDIAETFDLDPLWKGFVGSASFFGMLFGSLVWSVYADKFGRRSAYLWSLAFVLVAGLASAAAPSFSMLLLSRAAVGFGAGGNLPVASAIVTEFVPTSHRARMLCYLSGVSWGLGVTFASLIGLFLFHVVERGQEEMAWRLFLGLAALPAAAVGLAFKFLPESPRYLSVAGRPAEAAQVLEEVARINGKLHVFNREVADGEDEGIEARLHLGPKSDATHVAVIGTTVSDGHLQADAAKAKGSRGPEEAEGCQERKYDWGKSSHGSFFGQTNAERSFRAGDVRDLFRTPILRKITVCVYFGLTFLLPKYYDHIAGEGKDFMFILTALLGAAFVPASFLSLWLCQKKRLGRVGTLKWSSAAAALCIVVQSLAYSKPLLFVPISFLAIVIIGILAPILAEVLYHKQPVLPLLVFAPAMVMCAIFAGMIPVETAGRSLDVRWDTDTSLKGNDINDRTPL